jgi:hypothetical protein
MTQEDKNLLYLREFRRCTWTLPLKDLCTRLPYGVKCRLSVKGTDVSITEKLDLGVLEHFIFGTMDVLPYLRSMSSMSDEEEDTYRMLNGYEPVVFPSTEEAFDWLNTHHFDYRGLIKMGLALEAPEGMYKTE